MKYFLLLIVTIFYTFSIHSQNFIGVTKSSEGQTINLANDQVLEIKLPCNPSTGFGWYPSPNLNPNPVFTQTGNWEFESQEPRAKSQENDMVGQPGTEVIRFIGVSQGRSELALEYKRPWEKDTPAIDNFKVTIISDGKYTGNYTPKTQIQFTPSKPDKSGSSLPTSFSWKSKCTQVKNQANCGCCWAFATTGCFEAVINIIDNTVTNLSEQWLINCDTQDGNGCLGGQCAGQYYVSPGCVYATDLNFTDGNCPAGQACIGTCGTYTYHEKATSCAWLSSPPSIAQIKQAIYSYGPVYAVIDDGNNFQNYTNGVFTNSDGNSTNHAVLLVGWKDTTITGGITGYWILKNSWSIYWGERGYMRIGYGVSAVGVYVAYINYKGGVQCKGTPKPGNTVSSANPTCASASFTLSLQNFTSGGGVTYQWQSSPDNSTWTNINGATEASHVTSQSAAIVYYRCKVTCSGSIGTSTSLKETATPLPAAPKAGIQIPSLNQIIWNWDSVPGAKGYKRSTGNNVNSAIGNGTSTTFTQPGLKPNTKYTLYVWAYNCGNSPALTLTETTTLTGINEPVVQSSMFKIQCYPNPVTNELIVETSNPNKSGFNINLTNIIGQSIFNSVLNNKTVIDMSNFPDGMYIIKIFNENENVVRKIIKE